MNQIYVLPVPGPIGTVIADCINPDKDNIVLVTRINVPVRYRGLGLGTQMLKILTDDADKEGI